MQDAIYNQIQWSQNVANTPYIPYTAPTVAELSPLQTQAYSKIQANQGAWEPQFTQAQTGIGNLGKTTSVQNVGTYMNPYQQNVLDVIAKQGSRNLTENLLPGVSDAFIRAGAFGSGRMGEFGERAVRDTQEAILNQQAQAQQQGYTQALQASSADLARQQGALGQVADLSKIGQALRTSDVAALESAGATQRALEQQKLDSALAKYQTEVNYPKSQLDWLNAQVRGMAPAVPTSTTQSTGTTGQSYSASPLSQLAQGMFVYKGLTNG
jgi:hypothetical protein